MVAFCMYRPSLVASISMFDNGDRRLISLKTLASFLIRSMGPLRYLSPALSLSGHGLYPGTPSRRCPCCTVTREGGIYLTERLRSYEVPRYGILSHTWGRASDEVTFEDIQRNTGQHNPGYQQFRFCSEEAAKHGLQYFCVNSCCTEKKDSTELQEAITSMFKWYQRAVVCLVYLSDVSSRSVPQIIDIPIRALRGAPLQNSSSSKKFGWARHRHTTEEEDQAYSLFGILDALLPVMYGEGRRHALHRLHSEVHAAEERRASGEGDDDGGDWEEDHDPDEGPGEGYGSPFHYVL